MKTYFASAERLSIEEVKKQTHDLVKNQIVGEVLNLFSGLLLILNHERQLVAANFEFLNKIGVNDIEEILGLRPGEIFHCIYSDNLSGGCGTAIECAGCGAVLSILSAIKGNASERYCTIKSDTENYIFKVKSQPLKADDKEWVLIIAQDVSEIHFWQNLERVFFHDLNNLLDNLNSTMTLLERKDPSSERLNNLRSIINRILSEVSMQRSLSKQPYGEFKPIISKVKLSSIKDNIQVSVLGKISDYNKFIINWAEDDIEFETDSLLIIRVLSNMIINAIEAEQGRGIIRLSVDKESDRLVFKVWNKTSIEEKNKARIFQRYFSTKSSDGRGLGTFSMKLFGEKYLKGEVNFTSDKITGTEFYLKIPIKLENSLP
ncbi:MAG: ATP-binding protein [Candidatus Delongbacteria bacterium]|nr:ATP-binding protein [Candidatus Delongbacteria bacterium]MBN2836211.1 ATP-binding protein [Candidatus Delongbacteria bacterium]